LFTLDRYLVFFAAFFYSCCHPMTQPFVKFELSTGKFKCTCQQESTWLLLQTWASNCYSKVCSINFDLLQSKMISFSLHDIWVAGWQLMPKMKEVLSLECLGDELVGWLMLWLHKTNGCCK
jgi:hypothetical protein